MEEADKEWLTDMKKERDATQAVDKCLQDLIDAVSASTDAEEKLKLHMENPDRQTELDEALTQQAKDAKAKEKLAREKYDESKKNEWIYQSQSTVLPGAMDLHSHTGERRCFCGWHHA